MKNPYFCRSKPKKYESKDADEWTLIENVSAAKKSLDGLMCDLSIGENAASNEAITAAFGLWAPF